MQKKIERTTAEKCLYIVQCFINENETFDIVSNKDGDGKWLFELVDTGGTSNG
jgi:hypothetical protein